MKVGQLQASPVLERDNPQKSNALANAGKYRKRRLFHCFLKRGQQAKVEASTIAQHGFAISQQSVFCNVKL